LAPRDLSISASFFTQN